MKITQPKIKTTKYYSVKFLMLSDTVKLLIELNKYSDSVLHFGNMTTDWFVITGDYYTDCALYPEESVKDFDNIASKYGLKELSSKPQPEKNWFGKWQTGDERLEKINNILKK